MSMESGYAKGKRIASNAIVLFVRMLILTIVNLYAVRIALYKLGQVDYGIYVTIAGVVMMSSFLSSVLAMSVQRYYSIALGKKDNQGLQKIFSISINIVIIVSLIIIVLFETIGLWFLHHKLIIPSERLIAALIAYQFGLVTFLCSFLQIPFSAAIFAREEMTPYAIISTIECLMKLSAALAIGHLAADNLVVYSSGLMITGIVILLIYIFYGKINYSECRYCQPHDKQLTKSILRFSSWALFGSAASVCTSQGNAVLLNIFFGPMITAAFAIALQINNAFNTLCSNIVLAFRPAMIKSYAENDFEYLNKLFSASNKFLLYLLTAIAIPLYLEMKEVLHLWLGENVTNETVLFSRLMIVYIVCMSMNNPISIIMHATGKIMQYNLPVESVTLFCLPLTWIFFRMHMPSSFVFISMISVCIVAHFIRMVCLHHYYKPYSIHQYIMKLIIPALFICVISTILSIKVHAMITMTAGRVIAVFVLAAVVTICLAYFVGINRNERQLLFNLIKGIASKWKD